MDSKEQLLLEPQPLAIPQHDVRFPSPDAAAQRRSSMLPAIHAAGGRFPPSPFTNFSSLQPQPRPHSADSSHPPTSSFLPLFSSTHRVTAGGDVLHLTAAQLAQLSEAERAGAEQDRVLETTATRLPVRERIIILEPLDVQAKVDTGLGRESAEPAADAETGSSPKAGRDAEQRRARRRDATEQRRRDRAEQRWRRRWQREQELLEESKQQMEERIQQDDRTQPADSAAADSGSPPPWSSSTPVLPVQQRARLRHQDLEEELLSQQERLLPSLLQDGAEAQQQQEREAAISAQIQHQLYEPLLSHPFKAADVDAAYSGGGGGGGGAMRAGGGGSSLHDWLRGGRRRRPDVAKSKPQPAVAAARWAEEEDDAAEGSWQRSRGVRIVVDDAGMDASDDDEPHSDSASSGSEDSDRLLSAEAGAGRPAQSSPRPSWGGGSRPSTAAGGASSVSGSSPRSGRHRSRHRADGSKPQTGLRKARLMARMMRGIGGREAAPVFDRRRVLLDNGDSMEREAVWAHHASDVQRLVLRLAEAQEGGLLTATAPISIASLRSPTTAGAPAHGRTATPGTGGFISPRATVVMHGKDMLVISRWISSLARRYVVDVLQDSSYDIQQPAQAAAADAAAPSLSSPRADASQLPARHAGRSPSPLERVGLDRRHLYALGFTHDAIDALYSAVYSYSLGFHELLSGFIGPILADAAPPSAASASRPPSSFAPPSPAQTAASLVQKLWLCYRRLLELSQPELYSWAMDCVRADNRAEADAAFAAHCQQVERSQAAVRSKRAEVRQLKSELAKTTAAYEETLDGVSEARVTALSLRESNWREEHQAAVVTDEAVAEMSAKALKAEREQQRVYDDSVRVRERRGNTVKAITQAKADLHLCRLHHEDMHRLIAERDAVNGRLQQEEPELRQRAEEREAEADAASATSAALTLSSFQLLCYNRQAAAMTEVQLSWIRDVQRLGLAAQVREDAWDAVREELETTRQQAQQLLTDSLQGAEAVLDGLDAGVLEQEVRRVKSSAEGLSEELKVKLAVLRFELEKERRVEAAQRKLQADSDSLSALTALLGSHAARLRVIQDSYRVVYADNESQLAVNAALQAEIDKRLERLAVLRPLQEEARALIIAAVCSTEEMLARCESLPATIDSVRERCAALVPRQQELNGIEAVKGELYRALLAEKERLDTEAARAERNEAELQAELDGLDAQLAEMEEKARPLWRELDGKHAVLERGLEFNTRERETGSMRLCEEEKKLEARQQEVQASVEKLRPRQQQLEEAQQQLDEARAVLEAEQQTQDGIRLELREARESMQAKAREKEEFLARHFQRNHELQEQKTAVLQQVGHTKETLTHTLSELRASHSVNEQMSLSFDKRLQQWSQQLRSRQEQLRKKQDVDQQRKDVQSVKRAELSQSLSALQREHEAEEERAAELRETIAMLHEELQGEERRTGSMQAELSRLRQFNSDLTAAAPVLQHQLERVMAKDRHWDEREVEAALRRELQRRDGLMHRVAVLEEADWLRQLHRSERWLQTEPSRHFAPVRAKDVRQRFVLGTELGLMSEEILQQRQTELREEDEREEQKARAQARAGSGRSRGLSLQQQPSRLNSTPQSESAQSSPQLGPTSTSGTWAVPPLQPEPQLSSSLRRSSHASSSAGVRKRAASVIAANDGQSEEQAQATAQGGAERLPARGRRGGRLGQGAASHFRTQSTLPASWQHPSSALEHEPPPASADSSTAARHDEQSAELAADSVSPLSAATSTRTSHRASVASSISPSASSPAASPVLHSQPPHSRPSVSHRSSSTRSPAQSSHRSGHSAQPGSRPPTASSRPSVGSRGATASRDGAGEAKTRAASVARRSESPFPPAVSALDPAGLIPTTAMRPPTRQHPAIGALPLPGPPSASLLLPPQPSGEADEMLKQLTGRSYETQQRLLADGQGAVAEQDARTARNEEQEYEQFINNSVRKPAPASEPSPAVQPPTVTPLPPKPPAAAEAEAALLTRRGHRGALLMSATRPDVGPGALTEWLETQAQQAMETETDDVGQAPPRRRHALLPSAVRHTHLALMMPDAALPSSAPQEPELTDAAEVDADVPLELSTASPPLSAVEPSSTRRLAVNVPTTPPPLLSAREIELAALWTPPVAREEQSAVMEAEERSGLTARLPRQWPAAAAAETVRDGPLRRRADLDDEKPGRLPNYVKRSIRARYAQMK